MIYPPNQKPPIWSIDPGVIAYNCQKAGMPHPALAMPMWEGAGNRARDYSGRGNHGDLVNDPAWLSDGIRFDGNTNYINVPDNPNTDFVTNGCDFSLSVRVKPTDDAATRQRIIHRTESISPENNWNLVWDTASVDHGFAFAVRDGGIQYDVETGTGLSINKWYDIVATWDDSSNSVAIWKNGELFSANYGGSLGGGDDNTLRIAHRSGGAGDADLFEGGIRTTNIFNTILTPTQIKTLHYYPYFMYQIPEELYGYVAAVAGISMPLLMQQMNQFDGGTYALC